MTRFVICQMCPKPIEEDDDTGLCWACSIHCTDEDCKACGSTLSLDGTCLCDLGYPRVDRSWDRAA
jgi:hypothetical protein